MNRRRWIRAWKRERRRKSIPSINLCRTSRTGSTAQMSLGCTALRSSRAHVPTHTTGPSALSCTLVRMQEGETHENIITAVFLARSSERVHAVKGMLVSMPMESLNVGCTLHSIGLDYARMRPAVPAESASLLTNPTSSVPFIRQLVLHCPPHDLLLQLH